MISNRAAPGSAAAEPCTHSEDAVTASSAVIGTMARVATTALCGFSASGGAETGLAAAS